MKAYGKNIPLPAALAGICDFAIDIEREGEIRILQLTDMQIIDSSQRRYPGRLGADEIAAWDPSSMDAVCLNQIRSLVAQARPDLILITGDIVYGEFDDSGRIWELFLAFMESLGVPWAPVFGNHDNETERGVDWQCEKLTACPSCLFARGEVTGNGNYTVAVLQNGRPVRLIHMLDSGGCMRPAGIFDDQAQMVASRAAYAKEAGLALPAFLACHITPKEYIIAQEAMGYTSPAFTIGVEHPARNGDFGCHMERTNGAHSPEGFMEILKRAGIDGLFAAHDHANCTSILYEGIRFTYGLKTGQYDYYVPGMLGGTLITLRGRDFDVHHLPILTPLGPTVNHSRYW